MNSDFLKNCELFWRWLDYKDASLFQAIDLILDYDYYYGEDYDKNMTEIDDLHSTTSTYRNYDAFTEATTETTSTATSTVTTIIETTQNLTSGKQVLQLVYASGFAKEEIVQVAQLVQQGSVTLFIMVPLVELSKTQ